MDLSGNKISILCPTRERPHGAWAMRDSALRDCPEDVEILFYIADNDPCSEKYEDSLPRAEITTGRHVTTTTAWNTLYAKCSGDLIMLAADDVTFDTPGWCDILRERASPYIGLPHVFHFRDSRHDEGTPHPIVTREWARLMGWFLPPWFNHWYVDTFTCGVAKKAGVFTPIHEVLLSHRKCGKSAKRYPWSQKWYFADVRAWNKSGEQFESAVAQVRRAITG